jgi:hypothetical protein
MSQMLLSRFGIKLGAESEFYAVESPFVLASHANKLSYLSEKTPRFVFTGRSDFIGASNKRMQKDNLFQILTDFRDAGARIFVQEPIEIPQKEFLKQHGFEFYPIFDREDMTNGVFANYVGDFQGQIVAYNLVNQTLKRRVSNGLSTRYALGLCSPAPMVIQTESLFAVDKVEGRGIGVAFSSISKSLVSEINEQNYEFRQNWWMKHKEWAGEENSQLLLEALTWRR